ncbi:MAG: FGGY family carbohydrate kinase [Saprospiraceae bacterium]
MYSLGIDIGSSSVKVNILNIENGESVANAFYPKNEMKIISKKSGWAEQNPETWWENFLRAYKEAISKYNIDTKIIVSIGITYQMHGLVAVDKYGNILRPSIIWCDSRANEIGEKAFEEIGQSIVLDHLLNSPGNFTAAKLSWVKNNEPEIFEKIDKIMLPGDFISYKLTGKINTTVSGLSEAILWDFKNENVSELILNYFGFNKNIIPGINNTFDIHGNISTETAKELGLKAGIPVSYKAGDQPNNAFSLNVNNPGEIAATAGTSGVIYGITDKLKVDQKSRVNTFAHVNHNPYNRNLGILLCVNGTGIMNSWLKNNFFKNLTYPELNHKASEINIGSDGLCVYPFGNGSERILENKNIGSSIKFLNFNIHNENHILRAAQEGIVFSLYYGIKIMQSLDFKLNIIKAGMANMFQSNIFKQSLSDITNCEIELYNTDGALGAARGAAYSSGFYKSFDETFNSLKKIETITPNNSNSIAINEAYNNWEENLNKILNH